MENEKRDIKVAIISIILAIVCLIILGYIIYIRVNNDSKKNQKETPKNPIVEQPKVEPQITLNEVMALYNVINKFPDFRLYTIVTYETLSEELKDKIIMNKIRPDYECTDELLFVEEQFLMTYKNVFNHEKSSDNGICQLNQTSYECLVECTEEFARNVNKYLHYEVEDDKLFIYEKYGYLDYFDDSVIYLRPSMEALETIQTYTDITDITIEEIENKLPTYKHTFKTKDNNYYWVSSEIVNQS